MSLGILLTTTTNERNLTQVLVKYSERSVSNHLATTGCKGKICMQ